MPRRFFLIDPVRAPDDFPGRLSLLPRNKNIRIQPIGWIHRVDIFIRSLRLDSFGSQCTPKGFRQGHPPAPSPP